MQIPRKRSVAAKLRHITAVLITSVAILATLSSSQRASYPQFRETAAVTRAVTSTGDFKGFNWADTRDNFQDGVIYLSGLGPLDTYESASTVADRVVGQMHSLTGANTVRLPINEATVREYWNTYVGAIDASLEKGRVILCYWAARGGRPKDLTAFYAMWETVTDRYSGNPNAYFEPINEPYAYHFLALNDFYYDWITRFAFVPRHRIILDGSGYAEHPATVGVDDRLAGSLLGYHKYAYFGRHGSETEWQAHMRLDVGDFWHRTVCTEFGAVMNVGLLDGKKRYSELLDYGAGSSNPFVVYFRAVTGLFRERKMGSIYWPGVRDDDIYRLATTSGSGSEVHLSINNSSGLSRLKYAWSHSTASSSQMEIPGDVDPRTAYSSAVFD